MSILGITGLDEIRRALKISARCVALDVASRELDENSLCNPDKIIARAEKYETWLRRP